MFKKAKTNIKYEVKTILIAFGVYELNFNCGREVGEDKVGIVFIVSALELSQGSFEIHTA